MEPVEVTITEDDIAAGIIGNPYNCPVARAMLRAMPDCNPRVSHSSISLFVDGKRLYCVSPLKVSMAVAAFDSGQGMTPFSFTLLAYEDPAMEWNESFGFVLASIRDAMVQTQFMAHLPQFPSFKAAFGDQVMNAAREREPVRELVDA